MDALFAGGGNSNTPIDSNPDGTITELSAPSADPAQLPIELIERIATLLDLATLSQLHTNRHWRAAVFPHGLLSPNLVRSAWQNTAVTESNAALLRGFLDLLLQRNEFALLHQIKIYTMHLPVLKPGYCVSRLDYVAAARDDDVEKLDWLHHNAINAFRTYFGPTGFPRVATRAFIEAAKAGSIRTAGFLRGTYLAGLNDVSYAIICRNAMDQAVSHGRFEMIQFLHQMALSRPALQTRQARSVIEIAAEAGDKEIVAWLVRAGYEVTLDAIRIARNKGSNEIAALLESRF